MQIRVTGVLEKVEDENLKEEIFKHPTRKFLQAWKENGIDGLLQIFCLKTALPHSGQWQLILTKRNLLICKYQF